MELLTPQAGLILWNILGFLSLALLIIALIRLLKNNAIHKVAKLTWVIVIIFLPLIGSILFLILGRQIKIQKTN